MKKRTTNQAEGDLNLLLKRLITLLVHDDRGLASLAIEALIADWMEGSYRHAKEELLQVLAHLAGDVCQAQLALLLEPVSAIGISPITQGHLDKNARIRMRVARKDVYMPVLLLWYLAQSGKLVITGIAGKRTREIKQALDASGFSNNLQVEGGVI